MVIKKNFIEEKNFDSKMTLQCKPYTLQDSQALHPNSVLDIITDSLLFDNLIDSLSDDQMTEDVKELEEFFNTSRVESGMTDTSLVPIVRPIATFDKQLNDIECYRLTELRVAGNQFQDYRNCSGKFPIECKDFDTLYNYYTSINIFDENILSTIKFCKKMTMFNDMCEDDKIVLIKNSCWPIVCLFFTPTIKFDKDYWIHPIVNIILFKKNNIYSKTTLG